MGAAGVDGRWWAVGDGRLGVREWWAHVSVCVCVSGRSGGLRAGGEIWLVRVNEKLSYNLV